MTRPMMGPIDWLLIEFDRPLMGRAGPPLNEPVRRNMIRVLDVAFIRKLADSTVQAVDISDLPGHESVHVSMFEGLSTGILCDEDLGAAGYALTVDSRAIHRRPLSDRQLGTPAASPEPVAGNDPIARLQQLGEMKEQGLLSDDEFTAAKAKLLGS